MLPIAKEYETSLTEVKSMENDLLATGYIYRINQDYIELNNPGQQLMLVPYDTRVKLNIFNSRLGFQILAGKVYISNPDMLRIVEVSSLGGFEKRTFFRLNVNMNANLRLEGAAPEAPPLPIQVENISLGGIGFYSDLVLNRESKFTVEILLPNGPLTFHCEVRRINLRSQPPHQYGCRFYDYTDKELDALYKFIFQQQMAMLRKRKNLSEAY